MQPALFHGRGQASFFKQALQPLTATLRLASILTGDVAPDIFFFFFDKSLLCLKFFQATFIPLSALLQISAVVSMKDFQCGGHFPNRIYYLVKEITVMRNDYHRPIPIMQVCL